MNDPTTGVASKSAESVDSELEGLLSDQVRDWMGGQRSPIQVYLDRRPRLLRGRRRGLRRALRRGRPLTARGADRRPDPARRGCGLDRRDGARAGRDSDRPHQADAAGCAECCSARSVGVTGRTCRFGPSDDCHTAAGIDSGHCQYSSSRTTS